MCPKRILVMKENQTFLLLRFWQDATFYFNFFEQTRPIVFEASFTKLSLHAFILKYVLYALQNTSNN